ncbi:MAG TPA: IPT/TIG domain-containing protein [Blastocatellia bacterium]|nr:IPT/TIG domain-containing protein [Blastocatellia bacterium]
MSADLPRPRFLLSLTLTSPPSISSISPTSVAASTFDLTINGSNFDSGAIDQIYFGSTLIGNGSILSRSSTRIVVREFMTGATRGNYTVKVKNSDGRLSNGVTLTLQ